MQLAKLVRALLFFGILGPPIGAIVFSLATMGVRNLASLPVTMLLSYIFGFVPAALTGVAAAATTPNLSRFVALPLLTAIGAASSVIFILVTGEPRMDQETMRLVALPGAVSAFILAALYRLKA